MSSRKRKSDVYQFEDEDSSPIKKISKLRTPVRRFRDSEALRLCTMSSDEEAGDELVDESTDDENEMEEDDRIVEVDLDPDESDVGEEEDGDEVVEDTEDEEEEEGDAEEEEIVPETDFESDGEAPEGDGDGEEGTDGEAPEGGGDAEPREAESDVEDADNFLVRNRDSDSDNEDDAEITFQPQVRRVGRLRGPNNERLFCDAGNRVGTNYPVRKEHCDLDKEGTYAADIALGWTRPDIDPGRPDPPHEFKGTPGFYKDIPEDEKEDPAFWFREMFDESMFQVMADMANVHQARRRRRKQAGKISNYFTSLFTYVQGVGGSSKNPRASDTLVKCPYKDAHQVETARLRCVTN